MGSLHQKPCRRRRGKLAQAAAIWARGGLPFDETPLQALRAFGASEQTIGQAKAEMQAAQAQALFEVFPENWFAVHLLDAMATQWNVVPIGNRLCSIGMRYESLPMLVSALRRTVAHPAPLHQVLPQLQAMEPIVLKIRNEG